MADSPILFTRNGGVATVAFNRPARKNAFDFSMLVELLDILVEERKHFEDRVLVLTGTGGSFCSGADVSDSTGILGAVTSKDHGSTDTDTDTSTGTDIDTDTGGYRAGTGTSEMQQMGGDPGGDPGDSRLDGRTGNRSAVSSSPAAGTHETPGVPEEPEIPEHSDDLAAEDASGGVEDIVPHDLYGLRYLAEAALALHRLPIPTIAKVEGIAAGAGLSLALACDLVVASESACFSEIFPRRGLSLDGGSSWLLPRLVGLHKAKELAFFGDILSARDALDIGLVNRVVPLDQLDSFVDGWAQRLASGPTLALSMTKTMLNAAFNTSFDETVENEIRAQALNSKGHDTLEAMGAFLQRREPHFKGR
ncbi:MAG: enoyl-CoA hydratase/isomerase family protein [Acidimicrobiales bacterium]